MKRTSMGLLCLVFLIAANSSSAQWNSSGNDISNSNTGNVGINTTTPRKKLDVLGGDALINDLTIGRGALATDPNSTALGYRVLETATGLSNTAVGSLALNLGGASTNNVAVGRQSQYERTAGAYNVATGDYSLSKSQGSFNTALGGSALRNSVDATYSVAVGYSSLFRSSGVTINTAVGARTLYNTTGANNTTIGYAAGYSITSGSRNVAIGDLSIAKGEALNNSFGFSSGSNNTALGYNTLYNVTSGSNNLALGYTAGSLITTGNNNIVIGSNTGSSIAALNNHILLSDGQGNERLKINDMGAYAVGGSYGSSGQVFTSNGNGMAPSWQTINTPSGYTQGSVIFAGAGGTLSQNNANFFWDNANRRLGIGTVTPTTNIDITGTGGMHLGFLFGTKAGYSNSIALNESYKGFPNIDFVIGSGNTGNDGAIFMGSLAGNVYIGTSNSVPPRDFYIQNYAGRKPIIFYQQRDLGRFAENTGNFLINTSIDVYKDRVLQVSGKSNFSDTAFHSSKIIIADGTQGPGKVLTSDANGVSSWQLPTGTNNNFWTDAGSGNLYNTSLTGNVAIGVAAVPAGFKFAVGGGIIAEKVKIKLQSATWPDYVFNDDYKLLSLKETEIFIRQNKHLPGVSSAAEVEKNGLDLGDGQAVLLKKIEELTLYIIDINKQLEDQKKINQVINNKLGKLETKQLEN